MSWQTTIGGWFEEMAENGYVYLKYKQSDVVSVSSSRLWRHRLGDPSKHTGRYCAAQGSMASQNVVTMDNIWVFIVLRTRRRFFVEEQMGVLTGIKFAHGSSNCMSILSKKATSRLSLTEMTVRSVFWLFFHRNELIGNLNAPYRRVFYEDEITRSCCDQGLID